ncbi:unnamed protein product [Closterium sp. NIES-54]
MPQCFTWFIPAWCHASPEANPCPHATAHPIPPASNDKPLRPPPPPSPLSASGKSPKHTAPEPAAAAGTAPPQPGIQLRHGTPPPPRLGAKPDPALPKLRLGRPRGRGGGLRRERGAEGRGESEGRSGGRWG